MITQLHLRRTPARCCETGRARLRARPGTAYYGLKGEGTRHDVCDTCGTLPGFTFCPFCGAELRCRLVTQPKPKGA